MVDNVKRDYPDRWTAEVEGSDLYSVEIELNDNEIVSWECDCPYDYGDICKHIVALLLYIKDNKSKHPVNIEIPPSPTLSPAPSSPSQEQEQLTEILKQTDKKELTSFLSQYAGKHPDFYQALVSGLHPKKRAKTQTDYEKEIKKCFIYSHNEYSMAPCDGGTVAYKLERYIEKAKSLMKLNCREEAISILLHIIREIGESYEGCDDYDGDLGCVCQEAAELIAEMIEAGLPDDLLKGLTDEIGKLIKNSNYDNYGLADLNELLLSISSKISDTNTVINIFDEALKREPDSFRTSSLVMSKIELLENTGKQEEEERVISHYLYLPEIRKIRLKKHISDKQYEKALAIIDEVISIAKDKGHSGTVADWKDEKLSVYRFMDNKEKVIDVAEDLFFNGRESMKYYHILKAVIPSEKWASYLDDVLLKSGEQMRELGGHVLALIYITEEYWDRLMDYVEKNVQLGKYSSLGNYESYLKPRYPERMLALYSSQIADYAAKNMGRDHYKYVAGVLKKMKQYPDGTKVADRLLDHFKSVYSNRRAMMEELGK